MAAKSPSDQLTILIFSIVPTPCFQLGVSVLMPPCTRVHGATSRFVFVIPISLTITPTMTAMATVPAVTEQVHRDETDEDQ